MKKFISGLIVCSFLTLTSIAQVSNTWSVKFSDAITTRYTPTINAMTSKGWEYSNTIILHGMEKVYNNVSTAAYLNYIKAYVDTYVNGSGVITASLVSLDRIHPGISCLFLYEQTGLLKYKTAATTLRNVLVGPSATYSKTSNGIFWHKLAGYDNVVMLDGIYMAHPFLAKYGRLFNDAAAMDTAINQTLFVYSQLYDPIKHLIKHAWNSDHTDTWADPVTGNSSEVWSRAMGWYMMALVDILKYVPPSHPKRASLIAALANLAIGVKTYQDATTKLWFQVVDRGTGLTNNYIETSGSAMFVYSLKVASDSGWISSSTYMPVAQSAWTALKNTEIDTYTDGKPRINNFAPAMSVQTSAANYVQATLQPVDCPVVSGTQHPHGYAAILMAASVMEFPLITLPVHFISFTARPLDDKIRLTWENGDETDVDHYEVERSLNGNDFTVIGNTRATGLAKYTFDDNSNPVNRTVYYRIKAISIDGSAHYSGILPVRQKGSGASLQVSPNPVLDGNINIVLNSIDPGKYKLKIVNSAGIIVSTMAVTINDDGNSVISVLLPASAGKGLYYVQLEGNDVKMNKSILVK
ncbi:MAG: glycoside hydrolase family 88 protein [Chitinophagaceae bacterium]